MRTFTADLHIHTALSPCADRDMLPPAIIKAALAKDLNMIAVCDHNTTGNAAAMQQAAAGALTVLAGIEITTAEEVHVVGLFPDAASADAVGKRVLATLPPMPGSEEKMLLSASTFGLSEAVELIQGEGGLAIAAHVDRPAFGVIGQLGFIPKDVPFDALEISAAGVRRSRHEEFLGMGFALLTSSDSHFLSDIGSSFTLIDAREPTFGELASALKGVEGRRCRIA